MLYESPRSTGSDTPSLMELSSEGSIYTGLSFSGTSVRYIQNMIQGQAAIVVTASVKSGESVLNLSCTKIEISSRSEMGKTVCEIRNTTMEKS